MVSLAFSRAPGTRGSVPDARETRLAWHFAPWSWRDGGSPGQARRPIRRPLRPGAGPGEAGVKPVGGDSSLNVSPERVGWMTA